MRFLISISSDLIRIALYNIFTQAIFIRFVLTVFRKVHHFAGQACRINCGRGAGETRQLGGHRKTAHGKTEKED